MSAEVILKISELGNKGSALVLKIARLLDGFDSKASKPGTGEWFKNFEDYDNFLSTVAPEIKEGYKPVKIILTSPFGQVEGKKPENTFTLGECMEFIESLRGLYNFYVKVTGKVVQSANVISQEEQLEKILKAARGEK